MTNLIEYFTKQAEELVEAKQEITCNYEDNYYGDQVCTPLIDFATNDK